MFLLPDPIKLVDRLHFFYREKLGGSESQQIIQDITASADTLLQYECITKEQQNGILQEHITKKKKKIATRKFSSEELKFSFIPFKFKYIVGNDALNANVFSRWLAYCPGKIWKILNFKKLFWQFMAKWLVNLSQIVRLFKWVREFAFSLENFSIFEKNEVLKNGERGKNCQRMSIKKAIWKIHHVADLPLNSHRSSSSESDNIAVPFALLRSLILLFGSYEPYNF